MAWKYLILVGMVGGAVGIAMGYGDIPWTTCAGIGVLVGLWGGLTIDTDRNVERMIKKIDRIESKLQAPEDPAK